MVRLAPARDLPHQRAAAAAGQADDSLDLVYAHSVLTHLTEPTATAWLAEVARVLRPGGLALMTFHDEAYAQAWAPDGVAARLAGEPYVVWNNAMEGSNYISAWTTRARLAEMAAPRFEVAEIIPGRTTSRRRRFPSSERGSDALVLPIRHTTSGWSGGRAQGGGRRASAFRGD
jgi:SAM-dependent methyltransferase